MHILKHIQRRHLVSLNTARIKLKAHPRIQADLQHLFDILKSHQEKEPVMQYNKDGYIEKFSVLY